MSGHQIPLRWQRSSYCSNGGCVEVARESRTVHVRDTHDPEGDRLVLSVEAWREFIGRIKRGDLDH
jgi:hypothetical protein